jgi:hypothetical protein
VLVSLVVVPLGGCSSGGGDAASGSRPPSLSQPVQRPSKDDFVRQANAICQDFDLQMATLGDQLGEDASLDALVTAYRDQALPGFRQAVDRIVALGFPREDDAALRTLFGDVYGAIERVEKNPEKELQASNDPFESVNQRFSAYGLDRCAP